MKFEKDKQEKNGYLLLESLLTLLVLISIVLLLNPFLSEWFLQKQKEQSKVERNRTLYEESYNWKSASNYRKRTKGFDQYEHIEIYEIELE